MRLRVGAIESVLHSWLLDWVRALRAAQPGLALELTVETSPVLLDQLSRGTLDIALAALPAGGGLRVATAARHGDGLRRPCPAPPAPALDAGRAGGAGAADLPARLAAAGGAARPDAARRAGAAARAHRELDQCHGAAGGRRPGRGHAAARRGRTPGRAAAAQGAGLRHRAAAAAHPRELARRPGLVGAAHADRQPAGRAGRPAPQIIEKIDEACSEKTFVCRPARPATPPSRPNGPSPQRLVAPRRPAAALPTPGDRTMPDLPFDAMPPAAALRCAPRCAPAASPATPAARRADLVQGNLVILPQADAADFLLFSQRNPRPCPLLAVGEPGRGRAAHAGPWHRPAHRPAALPRLAARRAGRRADRRAGELWRDDLVAFVIGCSFSFEWALREEGVMLRHQQQGRNVAMYRTGIATEPAGRFSRPAGGVDAAAARRPMPSARCRSPRAFRPCTVRRCTWATRR
jgi:hypothetical protein